MKLGYSHLTPLKRFLVVLAIGLGITITTGAVCGRVSQRWGPVPDLVAAADHLNTMPAVIGSWRLVKEDKLTDHVIQTLQCAGYVNRTYRNQANGDEVTLAIIVGPTGPISVHTPEICYSSQAYSIEEPREPRKVESGIGKASTFWCTRFRSTNATAEELCVYYAWGTGEDWQASESPRFEFAGNKMLFKLQMASLVPPGHLNERNACDDFLKELLNSGWKVSG